MKKINCFIMALLITATPVFASSKSLHELAEERKNVQNSIRSTQSDLNNTRAEMYQVQLEILALDETLIHAYDDLETITRYLDETIIRLEQTETELEQARIDRDNQFETFKARARVMHEYGAVSFLDVLLNAASIRDFLARWEFVNSVAKSDQEMVERMQAAEDRVGEKVEELARQKNMVEHLQFAQITETQNLERTLETRAAYFNELENSEERYQSILEQQRETERGIQAEYNKELAAEAAREAARRAALPMPQGQLLWPVASSTNITSHYGSRTHPIRKTREHHTGVDISAKMGAEIRAVEGGVVRTASRQGSYGNMVIVEHTGGMSTLYAHCSTIAVSVGQTVDRGQVVARIGSTGVSTGPHLHFEVRINGKDVNPKGYLGY